MSYIPLVNGPEWEKSMKMWCKSVLIRKLNEALSELATVEEIICPGCKGAKCTTCGGGKLKVLRSPNMPLQKHSRKFWEDPEYRIP